MRPQPLRPRASDSELDLLGWGEGVGHFDARASDFKLPHYPPLRRVTPRAQSVKMKTLLYVYGNCQANPLRRGLHLQPDFSRLFESRKLASFRSLDEAVRSKSQDAALRFQEDASQVRVFIYQAEAWDKSSAEIIALLPSDCHLIPIHSLSTSVFWPNYIKDWDIRKFVGNGNGDIADWSGDSFIVRNAKEGVPAPEIARNYLALDMNTEVNLDRWLANELAVMRRKEKVSVLRVSDMLEESLRTERQFYTANHPSNRLLRKAAEDILKAIGLPSLEVSVGHAWASTDWFESLIHHPVHPQIIEHYGLRYLSAETRYRQALEWFTFEEWVQRYAELAVSVHGPGAPVIAIA